VSEFRGLSGSAKQKFVLKATGMAREPLSGLVKGGSVDMALVSELLSAMQANSKPVKPDKRDHRRGSLSQAF